MSDANLANTRGMLGEDDSTQKQQYQPKAGRRRRNADGQSPSHAGGTSTTPSAPSTKKGWGEETETNTNAAPIPEVTPEPTTMRDTAAEEAARLEEEANLAAAVAAAPAYRSQMPQLGDLDKAEMRLPALKDDTADLSILTSVLPPISEEEDVEWVPEQLFVQVMSDIQAENEVVNEENA
eukprot:PhM_4_TR5383/c0_g1_i1/m.11399/K19675/IFT43; intraflagellar transport protein 43